MTAKGRLLSRALKRLQAKTCEIFPRLPELHAPFPSELCNYVLLENWSEKVWRYVQTFSHNTDIGQERIGKTISRTPCGACFRTITSVWPGQRPILAHLGKKCASTVDTVPQLNGSVYQNPQICETLHMSTRCDISNSKWTVPGQNDQKSHH